MMKRSWAVLVSVLCIASAAFASPADDKLYAAIEAGTDPGSARGVTFLVAPEPGQGSSEAWAAIGEPEKVFPSANSDGAGRKIRFVSDQTAVVELQAGGWKNGLFHKKGTIFAGTISAGHVYEFTAPIVRDLDDSAYFLLFTSNDDDQGTVEWYLQEDGYTGRHYRDVWRLDYAAG